jgi:DNA-binding transcriptional ArsR family regulator
MPDSNEEIYSIMFSSLKHPARRKILRMLSERSMTFSQLLEELGVSSSHLTYHLENLGELVTKTENGKYKLSTF